MQRKGHSQKEKTMDERNSSDEDVGEWWQTDGSDEEAVAVEDGGDVDAGTRRADPDESERPSSTRAEASDASGPSVRERLARLQGQASYTQWFRWHVVAAVGVFVVGGLFGFGLVSALSVETLAEFAQNNQNALPDELTVWTIFANNIVAMTFLCLGSVTFGILSALGLFVNGIVVGAVLPLALQESSAIVVFALIAPHGIVEIPALLMAGAIGFRVPHRIVRYLLGWDDTPLTKTELYELAVLFLVLVVLIAIAAVIEVQYTRDIADAVAP